MEPTTTATTAIEVAPASGPLGIVRRDTPRALVLAEALRESSEQREMLRQYVGREMVDGADYGVIPGTEKKTLLKPGAEKLCDLFRCTAKFKILRADEDWERGFFNYRFRCRIVSRESGEVMAEGYGSANSMEGRYRWRSAARKCPDCGKEAIIKGKAEYGGGWLCFKKKGGCGRKFDETDSAIVGQSEGKVENDDIATQVNTILKMAKKRALVDGVLTLARCSDIFTQDLEDLEPLAPPEPKAAPPAPAKVSTPARPPPPVAAPAIPVAAPRAAGPVVVPDHDQTAEEKQVEVRKHAAMVRQSKGAAKDMVRLSRIQDVFRRLKPRGIDSKQRAMDATESVLGTPKPSAEWTEEDLAAMERYARDEDIPF